MLLQSKKTKKNCKHFLEFISKSDGITDTTAKDEPQAKVAKTDANEPKQESADLKSKETSASNDTAGKSTQETRSTRRTRN